MLNKYCCINLFSTLPQTKARNEGVTVSESQVGKDSTDKGRKIDLALNLEHDTKILNQHYVYENGARDKLPVYYIVCLFG